MKCEWSPSCSDDATHRLEIKYVESSSEAVHYYCTAHLLVRRSEIDADELLEVVASSEL